MVGWLRYWPDLCVFGSETCRLKAATRASFGALAFHVRVIGFLMICLDGDWFLPKPQKTCRKVCHEDDRYIYIDDVFRIIFKFPRHLFFWVAESSSSGWCEIGRMESRLGSAMFGDGQATNNGKYHATWPLGMYGLAFGCIWQCLKLVLSIWVTFKHHESPVAFHSMSFVVAAHSPKDQISRGRPSCV